MAAYCEPLDEANDEANDVAALRIFGRLLVLSLLIACRAGQAASVKPQVAGSSSDTLTRSTSPSGSRSAARSFATSGCASTAPRPRRASAPRRRPPKAT